MPTFFAGNILPSDAQRNSDPASDDHTFRFSRAEAQRLQLVGKDVRLEHDAALTVGKVVKQMTDRSGRVYVVGRIDADDKTEKRRAVRVFADKALGGLYNSLSLQHVHEEDLDGANPKKTAIEVSLVNVPRRAQCDIQGIHRTRGRASVSHAASGKIAAASKNDDYIPDPQGTSAHTEATIANCAMSADAAVPAPETTSAPAETTKPTPPPAAAPAAAQPPAAPVKDEDVAMQDVVQALVAQVSLLFCAGMLCRYSIRSAPNHIALTLFFPARARPCLSYTVPLGLCRRATWRKCARRWRLSSKSATPWLPPRRSASAWRTRRPRRSARRTPSAPTHFLR